MDFHDALRARHSIRAYLDREVPRAVIERILASAAHAPSGNNSQPWQVDVLTGAARQRLSAAIHAVRATDAETAPEYDYYPPVWPEPHLSRRRENGWALYSLIGVAKGGRAAAKAHHDRNFDFFGAPVGLIVSTDRRMGEGAYIDIGLFLQSLALAAVAEGLATCLQAAFIGHHATIRQVLGLHGQRKIICGVSLGYEDKTAAINTLRPPREVVSRFATFHSD
jgi:nitroreductase